MSQDTKNVKTDQLGDCVELSAKAASIKDVFVVREGVLDKEGNRAELWTRRKRTTLIIYGRCLKSIKIFLLLPFAFTRVDSIKNLELISISVE